MISCTNCTAADVESRRLDAEDLASEVWAGEEEEEEEDAGREGEAAAAEDESHDFDVAKENPLNAGTVDADEDGEEAEEVPFGGPMSVGTEAFGMANAKPLKVDG